MAYGDDEWGNRYRGQRWVAFFINSLIPHTTLEFDKKVLNAGIYL
jgi:hypothetical protein